MIIEIYLRYPEEIILIKCTERSERKNMIQEDKDCDGLNILVTSREGVYTNMIAIVT